MTLASVDMHSVCQKDAISKGPRVFCIRGQNRVGFGLEKSEIKKLFYEKGFNVTNGKRWRGVIKEWLDPEIFQDILTIDPKVLDDKNEQHNWAVVFSHIDRSDMTALQLKSEDENIRSWPTTEAWENAFNPY